jgi:demethylmenaquinone methyltransferase/2-methoxy-6-polyprenyl-1,4-benzoquinol methylase
MSPTRRDRSPRADLDKAPEDVRAMFDGVAARYDVTNDVLSLGQDRLWRRAVTSAVAPADGELVLDLAAGTGESSLPMRARGAEVIACDFSLGMLHVGKRAHPDLDYVAGDALNLPFADDTFDAVTISFGLRNVASTPLALAELLRVTQPGGRVVICEFSHPTFGPFRTVYERYLMRALPSIAQLVSSAPAAYDYLAESIQAWPDQAELATLMEQAGWEAPAWRNLSGGIVALHRGHKPASTPTA